MSILVSSCAPPPGEAWRDGITSVYRCEGGAKLEIVFAFELEEPHRWRLDNGEWHENYADGVLEAQNTVDEAIAACENAVLVSVESPFD